jgi:N-dimethylarginine dimethylaminohydrolase
MNGFGKLQRVYVRPPDATDLAAWHEYGWHRRPDAEAADREHREMRDLLSDAGSEVIVGRTRVAGDPDAIYAYDPTLVLDDGVILLRPGKPGRRAEPAALGYELETAGVPVVAALEPPAVAEGGDLMFLDDETLLAGVGYRTNEDGIAQLGSILAPRGISVLTFDLPHHAGPAECLHLLSFLSPLDADLVVGYLPMMPVRLVQLLGGRGVAIVEVPDDEFPTMGSNVLALGPRIALALAGNPETQRRMEAAGVDVRTYAGAEISTNGGGGPTCLTRPLARG